MARILVANDNADLLDLCQLILESDGHEVTTVANGREALLTVRSWQPDLVVVDWVMPDMDGAQMIQRLRANPSTAHLTILMMSGTPKGDRVADGAGADAFLAKPFLDSELLDSVRALLAPRRGSFPDPPP